MAQRYSYFFKRPNGSYVRHGSDKASKVATTSKTDAIAVRRRLELDGEDTLTIWRVPNDPYTENNEPEEEVL